MRGCSACCLRGGECKSLLPVRSEVTQIEAENFTSDFSRHARPLSLTLRDRPTQPDQTMHVLFHALLAFTGNKIPNIVTRSRTPRFSTTPSMLAEGEWQITPAAEGDPLAVSTLRVAVAGKELSFETGGLARQASGSSARRRA